VSTNESNHSLGTGRFRHTDIGNAERLAGKYRGRLLYCYSWNSWLYWDGKRWAKDITGRVESYAKETVRSFYTDVANTLDDDTRSELLKHSRSSESDHRIRAMISRARSELPVEPNKFDTNPFLLNFTNGTFNLEKWTISQHNPLDLNTKIAPVTYDWNAQCPTWNKFIWKIFNGDQNLIRYVQKIVGYSLTGNVSEQVLFFLHGKGANGKSTFIKTILSLLGDYAKQAPPNLLISKRGESHPTEIADLQGTRFVATVEVEEGKNLAEVLVKQLTGEDRISARRLYQDFFEFEPTFKLFLVSNHKPNIRGTDHAIWRRIRVVPFSVTIQKKEIDKHLSGKLQAELSGILNWALYGFHFWQKEGLDPPSTVTEASQSYRSEMDYLGEFLNDCCILNPKEMTAKGRLYDLYRNWCSSNGHEIASKGDFGRRLKERGFTEKKTSAVRYWQGISVINGLDLQLVSFPNNQ